MGSSSFWFCPFGTSSFSDSVWALCCRATIVTNDSTACCSFSNCTSLSCLPLLVVIALHYSWVAPLVTSVSLGRVPIGLDLNKCANCPTWFSRDFKLAPLFYILISVLSINAPAFWMNLSVLAMYMLVCAIKVLSVFSRVLRVVCYCGCIDGCCICYRTYSTGSFVAAWVVR